MVSRWILDVEGNAVNVDVAASLRPTQLFRGTSWAATLISPTYTTLIKKDFFSKEECERWIRAWLTHIADLESLSLYSAEQFTGRAIL